MNRRIIAAAELALILPATLFLAAVVTRHLLPAEPARAAEQVVLWYSGRMWTLWVLLLSLPMAALFTGCVTLLQPSAALRTGVATRIIVAVTLSAGAVLVVVVLHMLAN